MKVMEAENLSFSYGKIPVLDSARMTVRSGEFTGIIGSNGAGKSTFLKLTLGLLEPTGGSIRLFGTEAARFREWGRIGYVPQNGTEKAVGFPATVEEVARSGLYPQTGFLHFPKKEHGEKVREALRLVGMEPYAKRPVGSLSGGQQQRVMLARVLVNRPELLLLDEPTTGIDTETARSLYALLTRLNRENGITIVMVTHDVERASRCVSRLLLLKDGKIECAPQKEPRNDF